MRFLLCLSLGLWTTAAMSDPALECGTDNGSQVEIGACVEAAEKQVDGAIEAALSFAMESAKELDEVTERDVAVKALQESQTRWADYRDAQCNYVGATYGGGSGTGIAISGCRVVLGRERVAQLMALIN